ncbi:MAG: hypothetical protein ABIG90_01125 [bacterium]
MPIAFVDSAWWEKPAYCVEEKAEELISNDFGDRIMVWSEMAKFFLEKGIPGEYIRGYCANILGGYQDVLDLFNAGIRECLVSGDTPIIKASEFDSYMQETPQIAIKDHRVLNPDSSQRKVEIRAILQTAWDSFQDNTSKNMNAETVFSK